MAVSFLTTCFTPSGLGPRDRRQYTALLTLKKLLILFRTITLELFDMCIPDGLANLMMALFKAPICLFMRGQNMFHHRAHPASGVRQGCPLSPLIFAMLISPLATKLSSISPLVHVLLYADDLLIIIIGTNEQATHVSLLAWGAVKAFSRGLGLWVNLGKSAIMIKGNWGGIQCAVPALCARCAKSWLFSTTGSSVSSED